MRRILYMLVLIGTASIFVIGAYVLVLRNTREAYPSRGCLTHAQISEDIVSGISMYPLLKDGQTVNVLENFNDCGGIKRGDIVIYNYGGSLRTGNPLIKRAVGVGGIAFSIALEIYSSMTRSSPIQ